MPGDRLGLKTASKQRNQLEILPLQGNRRMLGGTSLRYDTEAGQFVQSWRTPKAAGCYRVTVGTDDGSRLSALFAVR